MIDSTQPYRPVYSIYRHQYLGCLISAHVVQELPNGRLSLAAQPLHPANLEHFNEVLDDKDFALIKSLQEISPRDIYLKYGGKSKSEAEFYFKYFKDEVANMVTGFVARHVAQALPQLVDREVYVMGNDGYPAYQKVNVSDEEATVLFHFRRTEQGTRYFPTIKLRGEKLDFQYKDADLVCLDPAWMLLGEEVFPFHKNLEGAKLKPFLNKRFIQIPPSSEEVYYSKFVTQLVERYDVYAKGFEIRTIRANPKFIMFIQDKGEGGLAIKVTANYDGHPFPLAAKGAVKARMVKKGDNYTFFRVERNMNREEEIVRLLDSIKPSTGLLSWELLSRQDGLAWLGEFAPVIEDAGIEIIQGKSDEQILFETPEVELETTEEGDWFDIRAVVKIGKFTIPFLKFRNHILKEKRDYRLPDGTIAILPESWFSDYRHLVEVAEEKDGETLQIRKYQAVLLDSTAIRSGSPERLRELVTFEDGKIPDGELPAGVKATLRGYQKKGYDWLNFLGQNKLGGILADDMGLGKTLQTLTLLQSEKEKGVTSPSLIVMPTSLLYNWVEEARKFTPSLKLHVHAGLNRTKDPKSFQGVDLVLSTYGTVRQDVDFLKKFPFHYLILDESQMIKNPASKTAKAIRKMLAAHRLSLTGTPLENTLMDLWSQMTFLNPGLLGSENFFKKFYAQPIEKYKDYGRMEKLKKLIHPFILRRTKEQVATELPPKVEQVYYCEMSEEQEKLYEETKNAYRNYLMDLSEAGSLNSNKLNILAGLQKLRQIAIHPGLVEENQEFSISDSGKYKEFMRMLEDVIAEGSKVLVFSQFVKLLQLIRKDLDKKKVTYAYLDGGTRNRQAEVERFQEDESVKLFLISLKAGGVGLNLTAAEYVFILDPWWNPAVEAQAVDRSHRIGQTKTVFSYKFITRNSIEEKILKLQERKAKLSDEIVTVEDEIFKKLEIDDLKELLS